MNEILLLAVLAAAWKEDRDMDRRRETPGNTPEKKSLRPGRRKEAVAGKPGRSEGGRLKPGREALRSRETSKVGAGKKETQKPIAEVRRDSLKAGKPKAKETAIKKNTESGKYRETLKKLGIDPDRKRGEIIERPMPKGYRLERKNVGKKNVSIEAKTREGKRSAQFARQHV